MKVRIGLPVIFTVGIGVALAIGIGALRANAERRFARFELKHRVADEISDINHAIEVNFQPLSMLRVFFESDADPVTSAEFRHASRPLRQNAAGLQLIGWAPLVSQADREGFERSMREAGLAGFTIRDRSDDGVMRDAPDRPWHYPILYEEASAGTAFQVLGRDLPGDQVLLAAIEKAVRTQKAAAIPPRILDQPGGAAGVIAYVPVFRTWQTAQHRDASQPDGVLFGIYKLADLLDAVIAGRPEMAGLDSYVFDPSGAAGHRLVYWHAGNGRAGPPPDEDMLRRQPHVDAGITLLDQSLMAIVVPVGGVESVTWSWRVLEPSAVILFLTAVIATYLAVSALRERQLDAMAQNLRDTTAGLRSKAATIAHMARHDGLTGLPNRGFFTEALEHGIAGGAPCAILQIGLDRFKAVNEFHGHGAGDAVLREAGKRLRAVTRSDALVARLGGDEFAVVVADPTGGQGAAAIARRLIEAIRQPIEISHGCVAVGATIGLAFFPADGNDAEKLLRAADLAMDTAKRRDRGSLCQFEPGMDEDVRRRIALEADLRRAIEAGDIKPYYQPVVRLQDAALVGFEVLARWHHPERGLVMPDAFISLAENTGLIAEMTYGLLHRAATDAKHWGEDLYLALNISPIHLQKAELPERILAILDQTGFDPTRLEVEITESALVSNMDMAKTSLLALQQAGVRAALDDFGTGYSSLVHLRRLPLHKVKIDRSFVSHLLEDRENGKIVAAIVGLGKSLGIATTAEGIETKDVALSLAGLGCDYGQGYYFAKPMTAEAAVAFYGLDRNQGAAIRHVPALPEPAERLQMSGGAAR